MTRRVGVRRTKTAPPAGTKLARRRNLARSQRTRARLLEVAGRIFAARGFDGATGQDICRKARVHTAAIVYHFGGMAGLYRAVLDEARQRLVTTEALADAVRAHSDPRHQLAAFLGLIVDALMSPASQAWPGKLFGREFISPSIVHVTAHDQELTARSKLLKSIVSALTGMRPDDPRVARCCISVMAPCALLLLVNRDKLRRVLPELELTAAAVPQLTRHLLDFSLAGLEALARQESQSKPG